MEELHKLSLIERSILQFCEQQKISKEHLTVKFKNVPKLEREQAIDQLREHCFLDLIKVINPETNRPRTLYFTTENGKSFLKKFEAWLFEKQSRI
jgi:hypothetical protein